MLCRPTPFSNYLISKYHNLQHLLTGRGVSTNIHHQLNPIRQISLVDQRTPAD